MRRFRYENEAHIREIFTRETGVAVPPPKRKTARRTVIALGLAAALCCSVVSAAELFSPLNGDDFTLGAAYEGNGIVSVQVENRSGKPLVFEEKLKLLRWRTREELPAQGEPAFEGKRIAPHSTGVMTIDLTPAYDIDLLEQPLEAGDSYYFLLTNNSFLFGQDWMCTVPFAESAEPEREELPTEFAPAAPLELREMEESLRFYFETAPVDVDESRKLNARYFAEVEKLLAEQGGRVVPTSGAGEILVQDPEGSVILDPEVPAEGQGQIIGEHLHTADWDRKCLAAEGDHALVLSVGIPMLKYPDAASNLPLFYLFSYQKEAVTEESLFFVRGRLISAREAEECLVFEDEDYLCYDFSGLFYSDLGEHIEEFAAGNRELRWDEATRVRIENTYRYYRENLGRLVYRRGTM